MAIQHPYEVCEFCGTFRMQTGSEAVRRTLFPDREIGKLGRYLVLEEAGLDAKRCLHQNLPIKRKLYVPKYEARDPFFCSFLSICLADVPC